MRKHLKKTFSVFNNFPKLNFVSGFFVLFFLIILQKVFSYTVLNNEFYKELADNQQISKVSQSITRGTILSSNKEGGVLGTSVNLDDLAIDPHVNGDKGRLSIFLRDTVYKQICYMKSRDDCYNNMLRFVKKLEIPDFEMREEYLKSIILERVKSKIKQTKVTSIFLAKDLDGKTQTDIFNMNLTGIYLNDGRIYANPEEINNPDLVVDKLYNILGYEKKELKYLIRKRKLKYVPIINKISIGTSEEIRSYLKEESRAIKDKVLDEQDSIGNFIILTPIPNRFYPEFDVASQLIGFTNNKGKGVYGIEGFFDELLRGKQSELIRRKDIKGRIIGTMELEKESLSYGTEADIYTTIDRNIQKKVEDILEKGVKEYKANKGSVVVMEPKTGRIISMANYPTFDLNNPGNVYELEKVTPIKYPNPLEDLLGIDVFVEDNINGEEFYYNSKIILLRKAIPEEIGNPLVTKYKYKNDFGAGVYKNDAISSLYEPGSIFKAITVAVGLDTGEITKNSMYTDKGEVTIDNFTIKNVSDKCLGYHSFSNALNYSCNVGMIRIVQRVGKSLLYQYLEDFGFGGVTGITLEGEVSSKITPFEKWSTAKLLTTSFGLGIGTTPLQMASAYSVLANGGIYVKPQIVDKIVYKDGRTIKYKQEKVRRVIRKETSDLITSMLVDSLTSGVAKNGYVPGFHLAGKTGTSQIASKGGYEEGVGSTYASFAGYGPAEDPKFVIIIKLERPRVNEYGGQTSAFLFKQISEYMLDYYKIPKPSKG
ncbi:hypothetical protein CSB08_01365 [Candidatus Gracilibacteria bacterium]|nr:MAG: hypothetical protein CSB08_01365 [Candidatus Gracilibacteria bacterium]PIE85382.1 MAG: hypothetical protein CSA08_02280 [Candidatus Gracilibacteria bacterium]